MHLLAAATPQPTRSYSPHTMASALDLFRVFAACTSTMMLLSPVPSIYRTWKTKTTGVASIVPLVSLFMNSHIAVMYGYLSELYFPVFSTFVLGDILSLTYISIFYVYSHERHKAHRTLLLFGIPLALITLYGVLGGFGVTNQHRLQVGNIMGYLGIVANIILYSSPMERIGHVLKYRSAVFINIHMICAGTFNNSMWITYGYLSHNMIIFAPNVFCCTMGCLQIVLYLVFHPITHPYVPQHRQTHEFPPDVEMGEITHNSTAYKNGAETDSQFFVPIASPLAPAQPPRSNIIA